MTYSMWGVGFAIFVCSGLPSGTRGRPPSPEMGDSHRLRIAPPTLRQNEERDTHYTTCVASVVTSDEDTHGQQEDHRLKDERRAD